MSMNSSLQMIELLHAPIELPPFERIITPDDVGGSAAWQTLVHDGALRPLYGEAALPVGVVDTAELRAQAVRHCAPIGAQGEGLSTALSGLSAAWVWLGGQAPQTMEYAVAIGKRQRDEPGIQYRYSPFDASHVLEVSGLWVTNLERTVRDLALWYEAEVAMPLILKLVASGANIAEAGLMLERPLRLVRRPTARDILQAAALATKRISR